MSAELPVRYPDAGSPRVMTRRAWWLVGLNILIPGSAQVLAGSRRLGRFGLATTILWWLLVVAAVVLALVDRALLLTVVTTTAGLAALTGLAVFYGVVWIVLGLDTLRLVRLVKVGRGARGPVAAVALLALTATTVLAGVGAVNSVAAIGLLDAVFRDGSIAEPVDGRYNILLLGGDAGPDRVGLRPDSISVASVDAVTGGIVMFGIPRNLERVPFAAGSPLWGPFPNGYDCGSECLISYLYPYAEEHPDLYPDAVAAGSRPGIEAMRDAVEGVLGLTLQYSVLIDMQGFVDLVDALGGIDIDVAERLPIGSNTYDDGSPAEPIGYIEAGPQHMDGATALWYARSRYGTDDFERMERQRQVQEAILRQVDPATVLFGFRGVASAGSQAVATDIPEAMLGHFVDLAASSRELPLVTIDFVPPEYHPGAPDFAAIQAAVDLALTPVTPSPTP